MNTVTTTISRISRSLAFVEASLRFTLGFGIVLFFSVVISYACSQKAIRKRDRIIHLLLNIFVPTAVSWEYDYSNLFQYSKSERHATIRLSLSGLMQHFCNGSLELRDVNDLAPFLCGRLRISDWTVGIKTEMGWWFRAGYKLALDKCCPGTYYSPIADQLPHFVTEYWGIDQKTSIEALLYDLDMVPYGHLEAAIHDIKRSQANKHIVFEFSTVGKDVSYYSSSFLICCIPFLEAEPGKRSSTPLLLSLHSAIELLSASAFNIWSIHDVSSSHADSLQQKTCHLVVDKVIRTSFTGSKGLECWRKAKLLLSWEAGLLAEGRMKRWRVLCNPDSTKHAYIVNL